MKRRTIHIGRDMLAAEGVSGVKYRPLFTGDITESTARQFTDAELESTIEKCGSEASKIETQLAEARARKIKTGQYADGDWYQRAESAKKILNRQVNIMHRERARREKQTGAAMGFNLERAFLEICRRDLEPDDFRDILDEAKSIMRGQAPWPGGSTTQHQGA